uniref:Uncharacterized protein n=1 Tax=Pyxicephalus adspersus TaxID=30357 RepID=A0AAV2ZY51_PYXAD|nr:TPA: hypothetical protein GDO54_014417 [Pyxicephalus adspersus]
MTAIDLHSPTSVTNSQPTTVAVLFMTLHFFPTASLDCSGARPQRPDPVIQTLPGITSACNMTPNSDFSDRQYARYNIRSIESLKNTSTSAVAIVSSM